MDTLKMDTIKTEIRAFISKNFLFGGNEGLAARGGNGPDRHVSSTIVTMRESVAETRRR